MLSAEVSLQNAHIAATTPIRAPPSAVTEPAGAVPLGNRS
jgi:hypothetical protein